jgi:hypothetical protein
MKLMHQNLGDFNHPLKNVGLKQSPYFYPNLNNLILYLIMINQNLMIFFMSCGFLWF